METQNPHAHPLNISIFCDCSVDTDHVYASLGNYTAEVHIHNEASTELLTLLIAVEPVLEDVIEIQETYTPKAVPLDVDFVIRQTTNDDVPPINVWCALISDASMGNDSITSFATITQDTSGHIRHQYTIDKTNSTPEITCENHVSSFIYSGEIKQQENFTNVTLITNANGDHAVRTGDDVIFYLIITEGSHAVIDIIFGDSNTEAITDYDDQLSYAVPIEIHHTYSDAIEASVEVHLTNAYFTTTVYLPHVLLAQNVVQGLTVDFPSRLLIGESGSADVAITVTPDNSLPITTNVSCYWNLGSGNNITEFSEELSNGQVYEKPITFLRDNVGLANEVTISCYNLVSTQNLTAYTDVYEEVIGISFNQSTLYVMKDNLMSIEISLDYGSHVSYAIQLGNGDEVTFVNDNKFASNASFVATLTYDVIGNFTPSVEARNELSSTSGSSEEHVTVQNEIANLALSVGFEYVWPPGIAEYSLLALETQEDIHNMHCHMVYYTNGSSETFTSYEYVDSLAPSEVFHFTYAMSRPLLGNTTVNATCSNMVSNTTIETTTLVTLDAVILEHLVSNETVLWTNTTLMILDIQRFGTNSCFQFDMGDNRDEVLYGSASFCEPYAADANDDDLYQIIEPGAAQLHHEYVYRAFGIYNVTVFAFNHVSNDTISAKAEVLDWPCIPPNITFPGNESDVDVPLVIQKSVHFTIQPDTFIDCMKTRRFTNTWELYPDGSTTPIDTRGGDNYDVYQPEPFRQQRRLLDYGLYRLVYTASMFNVTPAQINSSDTYFEIVSTPLVPGFREGGYSIHSYDTITRLDLAGGSFDLDVEPDVKVGMTFVWLCRRGDEEDVDVESGRTISMNFGTSNTDDQGGCFGTGSGRLQLSDSTDVLTIDTKYMLPDKNYTFSGIVYKDDREAMVSHQMYIEKSEAPVLEIRCVEVVRVDFISASTSTYI